MRRDSMPITLLYIRHHTDEPDELEADLHRITLRYAPLVHMRCVEPANLAGQFAFFAERTPVVLVIRDGQIVGEAMGDLPMRELDRVVRCAVEWAR